MLSKRLAQLKTTADLFLTAFRKAANLLVILLKSISLTLTIGSGPLIG